MDPTREINAQNPYQADSIDFNRVRENAQQGYYRAYWSSYKGHVRGMLAGVIIGVVLGGAIGLGVAAVAGGSLAMTVAGFAGVGGYLISQAYGDSGAAAASRAEGLAERHARILDPVYKGNELASLNDKLMNDGRGHNFQFPEHRDRGKYFNWKSGTAGALVGAAVGALLATTGALVKMGLFAAAPTAVGAALAFGALGLTFGIDRSNLKGVFNQIDANSRGELGLGTRGPDLGKQQFADIKSYPALAQHRLNRQESISILEEEYQGKIFAGSVKGMFRGFAGGAVTGALIGAGIGLAAFAAIAVFPSIATVVGLAAPKLAAVVSTFAGGGALFGMKIFADAGREAGAESTARAIDNEFERNQELRERGITPPPPQPAEKRYFNIKAALLMGTIGAGVAAIAPSLFAIAPITAAGITLSAQTASALVGGLAGALYGIGSDSLHQLNRMSDWLYKKSFVVQNQEKAEPYVVAEGAEKSLSNTASRTPSPVTAADMARIEERIDQRPQQTFEQQMLSKTQNPTLTQTM